jgi:hypothetical protein
MAESMPPGTDLDQFSLTFRSFPHRQALTMMVMRTPEPSAGEAFAAF